MIPPKSAVYIKPENAPEYPHAANKSMKNINTNMTPTNFVTCIPEEQTNTSHELFYLFHFLLNLFGYRLFPH